MVTLTEHSSQLLDIEEIDLETLTLEELLQERADCKIEVAHIATQLMDPNRRPPPPEDDSPEWVDFRDWRRRARWALVHRKKELEDIKELLRRRQDEQHQEREQRRATAVLLAPEAACHTQEEYDRLRASATARRATLLTTLQENGAEPLLLRLYRTVRRLIGDGGLPAAIDPYDRETLQYTSIYLRSKYTTQGVRNFVTSTLDPAP